MIDFDDLDDAEDADDSPSVGGIDPCRSEDGGSAAKATPTAPVSTAARNPPETARLPAGGAQDCETSTTRTDAERKPEDTTKPDNDATASTPIYWQVTKTVDPGGVSVFKESGGRGAAGRMPLYAVVQQTERRGNDIRYSVISGSGKAPWTGWMKIESPGKIWLTCLGNNRQGEVHLAPATKGERLRALIIIDWDDTLFPTTWVEKRPEFADGSESMRTKTGEVWDLLAEHAKAVVRLVETAASLGTVALVTLAERPWVAASVRDFIPAVAEPIRKLDVLYAREGAMGAAGPPGSDPLTALKRRAMQQALESLLKRIGEGTSWENFISIGDSDIERTAAQDLGRTCQIKGTIKWTKTVKFIDHPTVEQLTSQVQALEKALPDIVAHAGHRNVSSADLDS